VYARGQLGRDQREEDERKVAEKEFVARCYQPRGLDAMVGDQNRWFEFRVLTMRVKTLETSLCLWGACGWDSKVIAQDHTVGGFSELTVFVILFRAHDGSAPGLDGEALKRAEQSWLPPRASRARPAP
jgi:hypothetical protein